MIKLLIARLFNIPVSIFVSPDGRGDGFTDDHPAHHTIVNSLPAGSTVRWLPGEYPPLVCEGGRNHAPMFWYAANSEDGHVVVRMSEAPNSSGIDVRGSAWIHGFTVIGTGDIDWRNHYEEEDDDDDPDGDPETFNVFINGGERVIEALELKNKGRDAEIFCADGTIVRGTYQDAHGQLFGDWYLEGFEEEEE